MGLWTEVKCYMCSRVCAETPGRGDHLERLHGLQRLRSGQVCTLTDDKLRCSRCGGLVYVGDSYPELCVPALGHTSAAAQ